MIFAWILSWPSACAFTKYHLLLPQTNDNVTLLFRILNWKKNEKCTIFAKAFALYTRAFRVWNKSKCRPVTQDNFFKFRLSKSEISSKYYIRTLRGMWMWMWICYIICQNLRHKMTTQTMIFSTKVLMYKYERFAFSSTISIYLIVKVVYKWLIYCNKHDK